LVSSAQLTADQKSKEETKTMTTNRTIASLSIAAIALLVFAAPAFCQSGSDQSVSNPESSKSYSSADQLLAANKLPAGLTDPRDLNAVPVVATPAATNNLTVAPKPLFSATSFKATSALTSADSGRPVSGVNFDFKAPIDPTAKKQFRADADEPTASKGLTFVPSNGQKMPKF
jgi:hypothetical protein